ncbi:hypothetical protein OVY01_00040 [Robbsia sp. Bb-Pol-6]|uniref:Uncharacterized protein n=1 Tax=Robbsia betulipollinis TaxID=2981849 RepID=A0ABT3ZGI8_9BURK|nr:hypothetical protein [Robbsia betulipollinis]MCY0385654.1 hypothetical protein [Robbsia betulipollinis]
MVDRICTPMSGKGKVLADFLMEQLGIPKRCKGFDVSFNAGEAVMVTVRLYAIDGPAGAEIDVTPVTSDHRVFALIEKERGER